MTVSEPWAPSANMHLEKTKPYLIPSFRSIDLGCLKASHRQVLAVRRKPNTPNRTKREKYINPVIPVIEVTEQMIPPTFRGIECEPG